MSNIGRSKERELKVTLKHDLLQVQSKRWVLVKVESGTPVAVETFPDGKSVEVREKFN